MNDYTKYVDLVKSELSDVCPDVSISLTDANTFEINGMMTVWLKFGNYADKTRQIVKYDTNLNDEIIDWTVYCFDFDEYTYDDGLMHKGMQYVEIIGFSCVDDAVEALIADVNRHFLDEDVREYTIKLISKQMYELNYSG